jgi:hypothetical protein
MANTAETQSAGLILRQKEPANLETPFYLRPHFCDLIAANPLGG